ncbi:MAG: hypothetical protein RMK65_05880 [Anaerolineae bacterium]|nr:hypothetical protein [Anaerolineae bacterium]MDW7991661.1 hypothetical protein [Anaerolineae bacterium]
MPQIRPTLFLMVGGWGQSPVEQALRQAHQAAAQDLLETLLDEGLIERAVVATDDPTWTANLRGLPVEIDPDPPDTPFHFGRRLADLLTRYPSEAALYAGGGSAPLMGPEDWREALRSLGEGFCAVTNNLYSSDWIAFANPQALIPAVMSQTRDNALGWVFSHDLGLRVRSLTASAATRLDLDTPVDLLIARLHPRIGDHLRRVLESLDWSAERLEKILEIMAREGGHLILIGRCAPTAWLALDQATHCWVRVFVEERGMIASGRRERGEVRSLLADYLERVGIEEFFAELARLAEGVLMDNRVLLAARGLWPSPADRFNADLLRWQEVRDPFLRDLTRAAAVTPIPIVMGGQSVVNGGLMALVEILKARRGL